MKKILVCVLALVLCLTAFVACDPTTNEPDLSGLYGAKDYLDSQYKDGALETPADYQLPAATSYNKVLYNVAWTVSVTSGDANGVSVGEAVDGFVTVTVDTFAEADILYTLTATISDAEGHTATLSYNRKVPKFETLTIAEFLALSTDDTNVYAIQGYVAASGANPDYAGSFVVVDATGSIFSYSKKIVARGDKVIVWGNRTVNSGTPQINTTEIAILESNSAEFVEGEATTLDATTLDLSTLSNTTNETMAGILYKITGAQIKKDGDYTNGYVGDTKKFNLYTNDEIIYACADLYNQPVNIYGYVRGCKTGEYLTVQVARIEWAGEGPAPSTTDAEKVAYEKANVAVDAIAKEGEYELVTIGTRYATVSISWAIKGETTLATLTSNKLTVAALPAAQSELTLTATLTCGEATDTVDVTVIIKKARLPLENKVEGATMSTFAELKALVPSAGDNTDTTKYYAIGWIEEIKNSKYGNMVISDAEGNTLEIYGAYSFDGELRFDGIPAGLKPEEGDAVVLYAIMDNYKGTIQMKNAWIMQINETVCVANDEYTLLCLDAPAATVSANFTLDSRATWTVKSGTGITIDGVNATVTQAADAQEVVLTATVGELTKDYTVTVAALPAAGQRTLTVDFIGDGTSFNIVEKSATEGTFTVDGIEFGYVNCKYYNDNNGVYLMLCKASGENPHGSIYTKTDLGTIVSVKVTFRKGQSGKVTLSYNFGSEAIVGNTTTGTSIQPGNAGAVVDCTVPADSSFFNLSVSNSNNAQITSIEIVYIPNGSVAE